MTEYRQNRNAAEVRIAEPQKLPDEYVDKAESVMRSLLTTNRSGRLCFDLTTSKIRRILSLINDIYNVENLSHEKNLSDISYQKLQLARIRIAYDAGRDSKNVVKEFADKSGLMSYIKGVGRDRAEFIRFAHYVEALVAWHRYFGGKDTN